MILDRVKEIQQVLLTPLDLLPQMDIREKIVGLVLRGVPDNIHLSAKSHLQALRRELLNTSVEQVKVVVFGGGTGLSNIVGGDSRRENWANNPFNGLKEIFPETRSIVCVTDNGGSTGQLIKDLPLVAVGDMRHVLLSSIQSSNLQKKYNIDAYGARNIAKNLASIFNYRFAGAFSKDSIEYLEIMERVRSLPKGLEQYFKYLLDFILGDRRLATTLSRPHCLGNLLIVGAIYREIGGDKDNSALGSDQEMMHQAIFKGINALSRVIGTCDRAVLPCTSTPAQLRVLYTNGVEILGEHKLSDSRRGFPVDSVTVDYCDTVRVYEEVLEDIASADILILAPGSLYSSIIPVFKVPGLADAVRKNSKALKILISNLWVQAGETDLSIADPDRKFHVSDMIRAYERNIPGGTKGLFNEVLCISLDDIPASVLQSYAVEGKIPIFVDREKLLQERFIPIECGVYSQEALAEHGVIQHDPEVLAKAIKGLYNGRSCFLQPSSLNSSTGPAITTIGQQPDRGQSLLPCRRFQKIKEKIDAVAVDYLGNHAMMDVVTLKQEICDILWDHPIIPLHHLDYFQRIFCIDQSHWKRDQQWDNVFSFYDPKDNSFKIRCDQVLIRQRLEVALMIALGESLLGNYAEKKVINDIVVDGVKLGRVYHLYLKKNEDRHCLLTPEHLKTFLSLARMATTDDENHYTRLINHGEGFTPPGLLMGLLYTWYIDNRLASHIEYKMSVMKVNQSDLIPEQLKMVGRRREMVRFFRKIVFN